MKHRNKKEKESSSCMAHASSQLSTFKHKVNFILALYFSMYKFTFHAHTYINKCNTAENVFDSYIFLWQYIHWNIGSVSFVKLNIRWIRVSRKSSTAQCSATVLRQQTHENDSSQRKDGWLSTFRSIDSQKISETWIKPLDYWNLKNVWLYFFLRKFLDEICNSLRSTNLLIKKRLLYICLTIYEIFCVQYILTFVLIGRACKKNYIHIPLPTYSNGTLERKIYFSTVARTIFDILLL